jgi:hypothetical protein
MIQDERPKLLGKFRNNSAGSLGISRRLRDWSVNGQRDCETSINRSETNRITSLDGQEKSIS